MYLILVKLLLIACSLTVCNNENNITGPLQKLSPFLWTQSIFMRLALRVYILILHIKAERITAISFLLVDKSFYFNGWHLMFHVKNRKNRINVTITHISFSAGLVLAFVVCQAFFFNMSSRIDFKSDLHLCITGG